jgi:DNA replication and repair protein RecF
MYLKSIYLKNFRIYKEKYIEFSPQINVIWGANATGKTTILEAVYYLISGKSFRTEKPQDLIAAGESFFYIEAHFLKHGILQTIKVSFDGKDRKIFYNSTKLQTATNLLGILQGVLMTPDDVDLVKGSPQIRRHFFDLQIAQTDPLYVHYLTRYSKAMQQRNCLLRRKSSTAIESFEHEMAVAAAYITLERHHLVKDLACLSGSLHGRLSGQHEILNVQYKTHSGNNLDQAKLKQYHLELFKKNRSREMELGVTLSGPHKDDLVIFLNEKEARQFASEGQQRSAVSSLRLSEWARLKKTSESSPLMLIDDLGISLDHNRKEKLLTHLSSLNQVFITLTEPKGFTDTSNNFIGITP